MMDKIKVFFKKYYVAFIIVFGAIILDLSTKILMTNLISFVTNENGKVVSVDRITVIKDFFYFSYARNTGAGWSLLSNQTWLLIIITLIALTMFIYMMKEFDIEKKFFFSFGLSMMIGGTLGNFVERIFHGYVTDFFEFILFASSPTLHYDWPIFNVADICLVVGTISVLVSVLFTKENVFEVKKSALDNRKNNEEKVNEEVEKEEDNN